jgi:hypothetical protein
MTRHPLFRAFSLALFTAAAACSGPGAEEDLPVEFREGGFSVGEVSFTGSCVYTAYDRCEDHRENCKSQCDLVSNQYVVSCYQSCWGYDCSSWSDTCFEYSADFDFGSQDTGLVHACTAWWSTLETSCGAIRPLGSCERIASTWEPEFVSVFECSSKQAAAGVCAESCELPGSSFGEELWASAKEKNVDLYAGEELANLEDLGNLLGGVLRADVIEAAWACLELEDNDFAATCLQAWRDEVVP